MGDVVGEGEAPLPFGAASLPSLEQNSEDQSCPAQVPKLLTVCTEDTPLLTVLLPLRCQSLSWQLPLG